MQRENRGTRAGLIDRRVPIAHASLIQTRGLKREMKTSAIYGLSAGECYANYDRESRCLKTCEGFLPLLEETGKANFLMGFCRTFTTAGMLANGRLYRLRTLARRMKEKGYLLLPTPTAAMAKHGWGFSQTGRDRYKRETIEFALNITNGWKPSAKMLESMMGYPSTWSDLNASATPLSLSAPK